MKTLSSTSCRFAREQSNGENMIRWEDGIAILSEEGLNDSILFVTDMNGMIVNLVNTGDVRLTAHRGSFTLIETV